MAGQKIAPPPAVAPETWSALLAGSADFTALAPWSHALDSHCAGLIDLCTGEKRIGQVLGNAGEVFAAVIHRRGGLRWILSMMGEMPDENPMNLIEGMDCLKLELVPKRELGKNDLSVLKAAGFKPDGKGAVWPQFRSWEPGWQPWFINQTEAEQLLADLPRLTAFYELFERYPKLYDERPMTEIPFLPARLPDRPLKPDDLDWQPLLLPPLAGFDPFQASTKHYEELRSLKQQPGREVEFECTMIPAASFHENGRPCLARVGLLVERPSGLVSGTELMSGTVKPGEAAGSMLMKSFLKARALPETIFIAGTRFQPVLQPLCDELNIKLCPVSSLPLLEEAVASLAGFMRGDGF